jgi:hypothetical protein
VFHKEATKFGIRKALEYFDDVVDWRLAWPWCLLRVTPRRNKWVNEDRIWVTFVLYTGPAFLVKFADNLFGLSVSVFEIGGRSPTHFWCNQGGGAKEYCTHCGEMESACGKEDELMVKRRLWWG